LLRASTLALAAGGLVLGLAVQLTGLAPWSRWIWTLSTVPVLLTLLAEIGVSLRRGDVGLDIVAALSMLAALIFGEYLAAVIVALMYAGGEYLENFAEGRASREMTALLARAPRTAIRRRVGRLEEVDLELVDLGDRLLVPQGEVVPVDGTVVEGLAVLDQSALTGESLPVQRRSDDGVMSGSVNVGPAFDMLASRRRREHLCRHHSPGRGGSPLPCADVAPS
jgi:cation transport ATPase